MLTILWAYFGSGIFRYRSFLCYFYVRKYFVFFSWKAAISPLVYGAVFSPSALLKLVTFWTLSKPLETEILTHRKPKSVHSWECTKYYARILKESKNIYAQMLLNWSLSLKFQRHRRCVHCGANNFSVFWHFPFSNMYTNLSFNLSKCNQKGSNTDKIEQNTYNKIQKEHKSLWESLFLFWLQNLGRICSTKGAETKVFDVSTFFTHSCIF